MRPTPPSLFRILLAVGIFIFVVKDTAFGDAHHVALFNSQALAQRPISVAGARDPSQAAIRVDRGLSYLTHTESNALIRDAILNGEAVAVDPKQRQLLEFLHPRFNVWERTRHLLKGFMNLSARATERIADHLFTPAPRLRLVNALSFLDLVLSQEDSRLSNFKYVILLNRSKPILDGELAFHVGRQTIYLPLDALLFGWDTLLAVPDSDEESKMRESRLDGFVGMLHHAHFLLEGKEGVEILGRSYASEKKWLDMTLWWGGYRHYLKERLQEPVEGISLDEALTRLSLIAKEGLVSSVMYGLPSAANPDPSMWSLLERYREKSFEMVREYVHSHRRDNSSPYRFSLGYLSQDRSEDIDQMGALLKAASALSRIFGTVNVSMDPPEQLPSIAVLLETHLPRPASATRASPRRRQISA